MILRVLILGLIFALAFGSVLWLLTWTNKITRKIAAKWVKNGLVVIGAIIAAFLAIQALIFVDKLF